MFRRFNFLLSSNEILKALNKLEQNICAKIDESNSIIIRNFDRIDAKIEKFDKKVNEFNDDMEKGFQKLNRKRSYYDTRWKSSSKFKSQTGNYNRSWENYDEYF